MSINFEWTEEMSVGEETIDSQHRELLDQINKVLDAIVFGVDMVNTREKVIDFLSTYIKDHFSYEEKYMHDMNFPEIKEHMQMHNNFMKEYFKIRDRYIKGEDKDKILLDIEECVGSWWLDHIGKEDKKYHLFHDKQNGITTE